MTHDPSSFAMKAALHAAEAMLATRLAGAAQDGNQ